MQEIVVNLQECMKSNYKNKSMKLTKSIAYTYTYMQLYTLCADWLYLCGNVNSLGSNLADVSFGEMFVSQIFERNKC